MFTPLHTNTKQELFKKHVCNQSSYYENYDGAVRPGYRLKLKYPLPFSVSYVRLVTYAAVRIKKCLKSTSVIKVATMKNTDDFLVTKRKRKCATTKLTFSLSAKMNGTQSRTLVNEPVALAIIELCLTEGISQAVSQKKIPLNN